MSIAEKILSLINWTTFPIGSGFAVGIGLACAWIVAGLGKNHIEVNFPKEIHLHKAEGVEK